MTISPVSSYWQLRRVRRWSLSGASYVAVNPSLHGPKWPSTTRLCWSLMANGIATLGAFVAHCIVVDAPVVGRALRRRSSGARAGTTARTSRRWLASKLGGHTNAGLAFGTAGDIGSHVWVPRAADCSAARVILLLAVPIVLQVYFNGCLTYVLNGIRGEKHCVAGLSALIGASNFFELAAATAISLFGPNSGGVGDRGRGFR
ncbi:membrane hypothetical protein [Candidatus Methylacidithermus pantelleriae]|uniref:Uncharacterized protein n=1 Tax=Candidatus Methylacidithermus pantelleriae TaxID=2744239 RepID=A0A8J2FTJ0_9BACT|nr:membrane hypothetical protein [Candidatus Methylacidithermus pantelleriae]